MPYKIFTRNKYTHSEEELDDEVYATKSEAEEALPEVENNWLTGIEVLDLANEATSNPDDFKIFIKKI